MVPLKASECSDKYSRCQVENCSKDPRFTIHNIPQSNKVQRQRIREQWIKILNIETKAKSFYVCGNHFLPEDFTNKNGGRLRLSNCAVPSRNLPRTVYNHQDDVGNCKNSKIIGDHEPTENYFYNDLKDESFTVIMSLIEGKELTTVKTEPDDTESYGQFNEPVDTEFNVPFNIKRELVTDDIKIEYVTPGTHGTDKILPPPNNDPMLGTDEDFFIDVGCIKSEITCDEYQFNQSNSEVK